MSYNYTNVTEHIIAPTVTSVPIMNTIFLLVFSKFDCFIKSVS